MSTITLFDYPKSSASYRVRIALNLAELSYNAVKVDLLNGAQKGDAHLARNPQGLVPVLDIDGVRLTQSLAILDYLNDTREMGLLVRNADVRAKQRALAMCIAVDLHPVCNLSVMKYATGGQEPGRSDWMQHFISRGLTAFEAMLAEFDPSPFCTGDNLSFADICLIPQLYNANRWHVDYTNLTQICAIETRLQEIDAFRLAHPDRAA